MDTVYMVRRNERGVVVGVAMHPDAEVVTIAAYEEYGYVRVTQEESLAAHKEMWERFQRGERA